MKVCKIIFLTIALSLVMQSCSEDFLDLPPVDTSSTGNFYETEADLEAAIVAVYDAWKDATIWLPTKTEFRSDNLTADRFYGLEISTNAMGPSSSTREWSIILQDIVFRSNVVLENVDNIRDTNPDLADRIKGEALFFRGYAYYWGGLYFGGLPLITKTLSIDQALNTPRSSEVETWQQAEQDLAEAVTLLPVSVSQFGRVDKHAAAAFLARVLLQQEKWNEAIPVLEDIRSNSGHTLEPVWTNMWTEEAEKTSNEYMLTSIWSEVDFNREYGMQFLFIANNSNTQGNFIYKNGFFDSFEDGDVRMDATAGIDSLGNSLNNKYDYGIGSGLIFTMDIVAMRYTDVELMYAEALTMNAGSVQQASIDIINTIRDRAGLPASSITTASSVNDFVDELLSERRAEFMWEGTRYADLKRHGLLLEKLDDIGYTFDQTYLLFPLPSLELEKMQGLWSQNPGYNF